MSLALLFAASAIMRFTMFTTEAASVRLQCGHIHGLFILHHLERCVEIAMSFRTLLRWPG
jgi:hypothetical protein